jgi:hypothetical protein
MRSLVLILPAALWLWGPEVSTRNLTGGKGRPAGA